MFNHHYCKFAAEYVRKRILKFCHSLSLYDAVMNDNDLVFSPKPGVQAAMHVLIVQQFHIDSILIAQSELVELRRRENTPGGNFATGLRESTDDIAQCFRSPNNSPLMLVNKNFQRPRLKQCTQAVACVYTRLRRHSHNSL